MTKPTPEQLKLLNAIFKPIGITPYYDDSWDGVEDGIRFKDTKTGEDLLLEAYKTRLAAAHTNKKLPASIKTALVALAPLAIEGDTGITAVMVSPWAVIDETTIATQLGAPLAAYKQTAAKEKAIADATVRAAAAHEAVISGKGHIWHGAIDLHGLSKDKQLLVANTLNWLEQYSSGFHDVMADIHTGIATRKMRPVRIQQGTNDQYNWNPGKNKDVLSLTFAANHYLGTDNLLYRDSLNETLLHELSHGAQQIHPEYVQRDAEVLQAEARYKASIANFENYLKRLGYTDKIALMAYEHYVREGQTEYLGFRVSENITGISSFKEVAQALMSTRQTFAEKKYFFENISMDKTNELSVMLGKAPRGHYNDMDFAYDDMESMGDSKFTVYTDSPEAIRQNGFKTRKVSKNKIVYDSEIAGRVGVENKLTIGQIQAAWDKQWNADTVHINSDEWKLINDVALKLYRDPATGKNLQEKKATVDTVVAELRQAFNSTGGNDALSVKAQQTLQQLGMGDVAAHAAKKGWTRT